MRLEYFQLIDRIVELDLDEQTIRAEATVPTEATIFEGHFPGYPLMPGVLLIEAMAQTSGWLVIAVTEFTRMPFLAALKEAKLRTFVTPGQSRSLSAKIMHEGSGYAIAKAEITCDGKLVCNADITFRLVAFPTRSSAPAWRRWPQRIEFPMETRRLMADAPREALDHRRRHRVLSRRRAEAHWQALASAPPSTPMPRPLRPTSCIRWRRSISTSRSRRRATSARWKRGSGSAPMPPGSRSTDAGVKGNAELSRAHGHDRRRRRRRARHRGRRRDPDRHAEGARSRTPSSTSG